MRRATCFLLLATACADPSAPALEDEPMPDLERCDPVRAWNPELVALEQEMLEALDGRRAEGRTCGTRGSFAPAPALRLRGALTCAARLHALDMAQQGFIDHEGSDDSTPWDRLRAVEYAFATADEAIVGADLTPEDILDTLWLPREGSCATLSATAYTDVGLGVALPFDPDDPIEGHRWAIVLAKPLE